MNRKATLSPHYQLIKHDLMIRRKLSAIVLALLSLPVGFHPNTLQAQLTGQIPIQMDDGTTFTGYAEYDGTHQWLLVGRGREGWEFDADGQGSLDSVADLSTLGTPAAFAPAVYNDGVIQEFLDRAGLLLTDVEIRLKRAAATDGSRYQEVRWRPKTETQWRFNYDTAMDVEYEIVKVGGLAGDRLGVWHNANTYNFQNGTADNLTDSTRIFTFSWPGHNQERGFAYGWNVTEGTNDPNNFLWEYTSEGHSIPYTEVYIRSKVSSKSIITSIVDPTAGWEWVDYQPIIGNTTDLPSH